MTFDFHSTRMARLKENNSLELRKLDKQIKGNTGLEMQKTFKVQQVQQKCDLLRRELAEMYFAESRQNGLDKKQWKGKCLSDLDTSLLLMEKRENIRRRKNQKLLFRAKQKDKLMEEMVKEFLSKLETETDAVISGPSTSKQSVSDLEPKQEQTQAEAAEEERKQKRFTLFRSSSRAWNEARNTRYIRSKLLRDFEVELSVNEIFASCPLR